MTDEQKGKVLDKIRKLLALSTSPNENEAASAAEKVQALLAEYNLTLKDIGGGAQPEEEVVQAEGDETDSRPWRRRIGAAVAKMYFSGYLYTFRKVTVPSRKIGGYIRYDRHTFVGLEHNVVVARAMFAYLTSTIERLAREGALKVPAKERSSYITTFHHTASMRLATRIAKRIEDAKKGMVKSVETGKNLPALLDLYDKAEERIKKAFDEMGGVKTKKVRSTLSHDRGVADGMKAGDSIGLDPQLKGQAGARLIGKS